MAGHRRQPVYPVPALEKGLDVIEALAGASAPMSPADLGAALNRTRNELFRLLTCLERRGWLLRDDAGCYRLSLHLFQLAHRVGPTALLLRVAEGPLQEIARAIEQSVHLSVLSQGRLVVLSEAASPQHIRISVAVGASFGVITTISGRLLLAQEPAEARERFLAADADHRALGAAERAALASQLDRLGRDGYGTADDDSLVGLHDIAVLCGSRSAGILAAIASPRLLRTRAPAEEGARVLEIMRRQAAVITAGLGVRPS